MIAFLFKNWKLLLDILLVVGAILAFTFWDPIGMFTNARTKQTANLVTGVRDIGQLVTAEYYGEVISSWKEFKLTEFPQDTLTDYAEDTFRDLRFLIWKHRAVGSRNFFNSIRQEEEYKNYSKHAAYPELITMLADRYTSKKLKNIYVNEKLKEGIEERTYKKILGEIRKDEKNLRKRHDLKKRQENDEFLADVEDYLFETPSYIYDFFGYYQYLIEERNTKKERKKNIVFIGRGSVKAGFDFGKLNETNFLYDDEEKIVHFYGIKPAVLDVDINPWFIPERKVKGFELVSYSGDVNFTEAKEVKRQCKQKLLDQARGAEIIQQAEKNGEEALQSFFALLLDEPSLKVSFHTHPYDQYLAIIKADTLVDRSEAHLIDSLYNDYLIQLDTLPPLRQEKLTQHFCRFVSGLQKLDYLNNGYGFSYFSLIANRILRDTFHVSNEDHQLLISSRDTLRSEKGILSTTISRDHSSWFLDRDVRIDFNTAVDLIENESLSRFDSTLNFSNYEFQIVDKTDSISIASYKLQLSTIPSDWEVLKRAELDTAVKALDISLSEQNKKRPLRRLSSSLNELIARLKK